jgi:DNA-binding IclR family transcriptional regulator
MCSVAAPVFVQDLGVFLSLGATGPLQLFTSGFREKIGAYLIELSKELGDLVYNRNAWTNGTIALAS